MSTRSISWGQRRPVRKTDNLPPSCAVVTKCANRNFLEPSGPVQACNGTVLPLPFSVKCLLEHAPCLGPQRGVVEFIKEVVLCSWIEQINNIIYLFTAIVLSPGGSGYFTCIQNMKLVTTRFNSGGLHEKHVVATWNVGNHLSVCL